MASTLGRWFGFSGGEEDVVYTPVNGDVEVAEVQLDEDQGDDEGVFGNVFGTVKQAMGIEEEKPPETTFEYITNCHCLPPLTWEQRLWGFGIFFGFGCLISFMSTFSVLQIMVNPAKFALTYTLGNVLSICSLMFLMGPCRQIKKMFDKDRRVATGVYIISMTITFIAVFKKVPGYFIIPLIFFQFCALIYYSATYIPYGREILKGCVTNACACCCSMFTS
uniref:Vesicle transport protein n=2 Tax=Lotharella globosa TaxID=91324 RepID=A0A7S3YJD1_9EUKA|mmetsp:Transcript_16045/g.32530  ORF Transcript_16045/g.32530 Transcript_16045/m.32530 type:complete len:221 (+) Transcript_16045:79-741(+)